MKYFHDNTDGIKVSAFLGGALAAIPILCAREFRGDSSERFIP